MSVFFCDTNSEITLETLNAFNINLIKMPYTSGGNQHYYDLGENTDLTAFFNAMRKGATVKTSALNAYDYVEYFEPVLSRGEDIVYVSFSHKMSGTFQSLYKAIDELKDKYPGRAITVADTKSISQGAGLIVEAAAKLHAGGASDNDVATLVENLRERTAIYFTVENLEYLRRGGRLSKFKSIMGNLLSVKPIITATDGALENTETTKGRKGALKRLAALIEDSGIDANYPMIVLHADCKDECDFMTELLAEKYPDANIRTQMIGPVIGCHCGPGTIGIACIKNNSTNQNSIKIRV